MSLGAEARIEQMIYDNLPRRVTNWRMKGGKLIAIKDMTSTHLINTINMLRRQIDGSAHDDFVYDNIIAMEQELRKRGINNGENYKR